MFCIDGLCFMMADLLAVFRALMISRWFLRAGASLAYCVALLTTSSHIESSLIQVARSTNFMCAGEHMRGTTTLVERLSGVGQRKIGQTGNVYSWPSLLRYPN